MRLWRWEDGLDSVWMVSKKVWLSIAIFGSEWTILNVKLFRAEQHFIIHVFDTSFFLLSFRVF